jgi:hypothetical protein
LLFFVHYALRVEEILLGKRKRKRERESDEGERTKTNGEEKNSKCD